MSPTPPRAPLRGDRSARARVDDERERAARAPAAGRQRLLALGLFAFALVGVVISVATTGGGSSGRRTAGASSTAARRAPATSTARAGTPALTPPSTFAVGLRVLRLQDAARTIQLPDGTAVPRPLTTYVRYPALGSPGATDVTDAPAARASGPFPLIVFGHGFAVTPANYTRLLAHWARAGYVVAAPVFPLGNANAPSGPNENDLINQPEDMRFVISSLLAADTGSGPLAGMIDRKHIAVAGHSDGGDTALAVAYDSSYQDHRVGAAVILSGAEIPSTAGFPFPQGAPPLLATQGTADTINPPSLTTAFFEAASAPKYRLDLLGAEHLAPYSGQEPQLAIVERVSTAFLDGYLKSRTGSLGQLASLGDVPGTASVVADP